jgi:hypothetical protein
MSPGMSKFMWAGSFGSPTAASAEAMSVASGIMTVFAPGGNTGGFASSAARSAATRSSVTRAVVGEAVKSAPNWELRFCGPEPPAMWVAHSGTTRGFTAAAMPPRISGPNCSRSASASSLGKGRQNVGGQCEGATEPPLAA